MPEIDSFRAYKEAAFAASLHDAQKRLDYADGYAQSALKSLFLVNGGAILALLTFIGNSQAVFDFKGIFWAFVWFASGIAAVLLSYFGAYFSQNYYMRAMTLESWESKMAAHDLIGEVDSSRDEKFGDGWLRLAIGAAIVSFGAFVSGAFVALIAIT